jgi:hypothetical protein
MVGFGGPETLEQVPAFVESVLARTPPDHVVASVIDRYIRRDASRQSDDR